MKKYLLSALLSFMTVVGFGQTVHPDYLDGEIWIKLKNDLIQKKEVSLTEGPIYTKKVDLNNYSFYSAIKEYKIKSAEESFPRINDPLLKNIIRIQIDEIDKVEEVINILERSDLVEYAERVPLLKNTLVPNDTYYSTNYQWSLFKVNAETAWDVSTGNSSVRVAIVDDAVSTTHSDLSGAIYTNPNEIPNNGIDDDNNGYVDDVNGYDVANDDNNPNPPSGQGFSHGTHVAGISGASTNNNNGIASIGGGVSIVPIKSTYSSTAVTHGYEGIVYAVSVNSEVINMSWGGPGSSQTGLNVVNYAYSNGAVLIAAAGNDNVSSMFYPAGYSNVIAVASTKSNDGKSSFSNYGSWIDVSAPGSSILSAVPGGNYAYKSGTSMASPMVAGLAGLILSHNPWLTQTEVKNCILNTATDISAQNPSYTGLLGAGRIDALAAMNCADAGLSNPPVSNFTASSTNLLVGQSTNFIDQSIGNPTTWTWTFPGGTPGTYSGQNPPAITYNNAGNYDVTLTTSNAHGNHTETKTAYIEVNDLTGCDTITNVLDTDPNSVYSWGQGNGAMFGHGFIEQQYVAEKYDGLGPTNMTGATFHFTEATFNSINDKITIKVWEDSNGEPGTEVYSEDVRVSDIAPNITSSGFYPTNITFNQPVAITTSDFYVGFELYYAGGEHIEMSSSSDLSGDPNRSNSAYYYVNPSNNPENVSTGWNEIGDIVSGSFEVALHIYPRITTIPPIASISATPTTVCKGETIQFDGTSSQNGSSYEWLINGATTPNQTGGTPNVIMNTVGTHKVYLLARNSCGFENIDSMEVTVNSIPSISVAASQDTICPAGSANLTATGATSYTWSPAAGLSCTNCPNPVASPTNTTTYSVEGTSGSCSSSVNITVAVDNVPVVADFTVNKDTVCVGETIEVNGSNSTGGGNYAWTFIGGAPNSATGNIASTSYNNPGTYTIELDVSNSCNVNDVITKDVLVEAAPNLSVSASSTVICPSESTDLTVSGANTYSWTPSAGLSCTNCPNPTATPSSTTTYTVEGAVGTCLDTESITIEVDNSPVNAAFTFGTNKLCVDDVLNVDASNATGAQSYTWDFGGGTPNSGTGSTASTSYAAPGSYDVELTVENACQVIDVLTKSIVVLSEEDCTASLIAQENDLVNIFYNTQEDRVEVLTSSKGTAYVLNTAGQKIITGVEVQTEETYINTNGLSKGMYIIVFNVEGKNPHIKKFLK